MRPLVSNTVRATPVPEEPGKLVISPLPGSWGKRWKLEKPLVVEFYGVRMEVPQGEVTDFASVPGVVAWLLPKRSVYSIASIFHDHLYRTAKTSKWMADAMFFSLLKHEPQPVGWCCRTVMWLAVWSLGWFAWRKHRLNS